MVAVQGGGWVSRDVSSVPPGDDPLSRLARLLEGVESLSARVAANRLTWRASEQEWTLFLTLNYVTEVELFPRSEMSADAALLFLRKAGFCMKATLRRIRSRRSALNPAPSAH
jgi:hypothetical protein